MREVWRKLSNIPVFKTLRFRLASAFLLLLSVVTIFVGLAGTQLLRSILQSRTEQALLEELAALRGYVHFKDFGQPTWEIDPNDSEDMQDLGHLRGLAFIQGADGNVFWSGLKGELAKEVKRPSVVQAEFRRLQATRTPIFKELPGDDGSYLVVSGLFNDSVHRRDWYVAVARSVVDNHQLLRRFRQTYGLVFMPLTLVACVFASWFSAGRVLASLQSVEFAARDITGSNLGLQIPLRGANDELDRLIESFNEMSRRLKSSFDQIRQFSTDVSHELRTPLTAIQGQLEVALFTAKTDEELREAIENALQDVERLSNLVRALLLLSHAESGQIPMNRSPVRLNEAIYDLVEQFQIPAEAAQVDLQAIGNEEIVIEADRLQIERVITNLLSNAIKYTPSGGQVRIWAESGAQAALLMVQDTGAGIPPDHLPHIFDRFYRVPDPNPEKGLGLGLSFVASIVRAHSGKIHVQSEPGKGSKFTVEIPYDGGRPRLKAVPSRIVSADHSGTPR